MTDRRRRAPLVPHDAAATVAAGGIAALGAPLAPDQRPSPVTARTYAHPALDGKVIVRLEPDAVAAGTDAEMAAFGFTAPTVSAPLGQVRFRTLGFPAWALVHQPKKAKAALAVTDEMRKAKRLVQAKPGHAKAAFEAIAKTLSRGTPQFLPSFWEEVGRVVADQASSTLAAQCFERARQAERAYKLATDPEDTDAVFVEFALLGALSAKTLSQYAKDLARTAGGAEAYRRFRAIVVKRALGGMPPYAGMGKDLQALAAGAGLDVEREADLLVGELIEAPGIAKAPAEFWTTYRDALVRVGRATPAVRARLRTLWPAPKGGTDQARRAFQRDVWLGLLDEIGALTELPDAGLGGWMSRLFAYAGLAPRTEALLREVAPRLVALGQRMEVVAAGGRWRAQLSIDLAELALSLGVPLAEDVAQQAFDPASATVDPVLVAGHAVYGPKLAQAVAHMIGEPEHEARMRGKHGFIAARRAWIESQLAVLAQRPFPAASEALDELDSKTTAETFLPYADLQARLATTELAASLALHLRTGIVDEYGWPAYEEAVARLGDVPIKSGGAFPLLTVWSASKVFVLDGPRIVVEHDVVAKANEYRIARAYAFGPELLVELAATKGYQAVFYWHRTPKTHVVFTTYLYTYGGRVPYALTLPDGRVTMGQRAFVPGAGEITGQQAFVSDGTTVWHRESKALRGFDPRTGSKGAEGGPAWLRDWTRDGYALAVPACMLFPVPGLASSPLGAHAGLVGRRVRSYQGTPRPAHLPLREAERTDGRTYAHDMIGDELLGFPGGADLLAASSENASSKRFLAGDGPGVTIHDATGGDALATINQDPWAARGWGTTPLPPLAFWHYLTPRDVASSEALRRVTVAQARAILDAALAEVAHGAARAQGARALPATEAAVRAALPGVTHAAIVRGVAGHAERAAELQLRARAMAEARHADRADASGTALVGDAGKLRTIALALAARRPARILDVDLDVGLWLRFPRTQVMRAYSPAGSADARRAARELAQALAGSVLADDVAKVRFLRIEEPADWSNDSDEYNTVNVVVHEGSVFALHEDSTWAIEYATDGTFRAPPNGWTIRRGHPATSIGTAWVAALLALPDAPMAWEPAMAERTAQRSGLSRAEATLLFHGAPRRTAWGKDFLGKPLREALGLRRDEAAAANETFKPLEPDVLEALLESAAPDDPALLLAPARDGGWADRVGDAWKRAYGAKAAIPQDLVAAAKKELALGNELGVLLPAFAGELDRDFLRVDLRPLDQRKGWGEEHGLTPRRAIELATVAAWLFYARPVGCPIRAGVPAVIAKLRGLAGDPGAVWKLDSLYLDTSAKDQARRDALLALVGGTPIAMGKDGGDERLEARDDGAVIVATSKTNLIAGFRPSKLTGRGLDKASQLARAVFDPESSPDGDPLAEISAAQLILSPELAALAERITDTDVPAGSYEVNPLASVRKLVAKVAKAEGISTAAAALYLQVLALPEPTQKNVTAWNGWSTKEYAAAAAELARAKLVVEGKRERAGRTIFLRGGYTKGDRENLPTEEWKLPFYAGLERNLPHEPAHALFERAYKRMQTDPP